MDHSEKKQRPASLLDDDEKAPHNAVHHPHPHPHHDGGGGPLATAHGYEDPEHDERWRHGWDDRRERRVLRRMDLHLLPFVSLLYLLSFLYAPSSLFRSPRPDRRPRVGIARILATQRSRAWPQTSSSSGTTTTSPRPSSSSSTLRPRSRGARIDDVWNALTGTAPRWAYSNIALKLLRPSLWSGWSILARGGFLP